MSSPTQRSLEPMRERGYLSEVTERWIPGANIRKDLAGFIDVLCMHKENERDIVGVQTTSYANISARVNKIETHENLAAIRKAGIRVVVHGWRKLRGRWVVKEIDIS